MKKIALATIFTLSLFGTAVQAAPATEASVIKLFKITKVDQLLDQSYNAMSTGFEQSVNASFEAAGTQPSKAEKELVSKIGIKLTAILKQEMSWKTLEPIMIKLYTDIYDEEEVLAMNEFYGSPMGQSIIDKTATSMQAATQIMQESLMKNIVPKMGNAIQDSIKEECKLAIKTNPELATSTICKDTVAE